ncbi:AAA family ATPase [Dactylosporangium siamense]|uniref:AAA family ATPase n=1 Tax=Dactylosporangium siamense TaxID=685454 RepID=UPI00361F7625
MPTFVGRERETARLAARLRAAVAGAGSVVLVGGEPGVGKTRLATQTAGVARDLGMVVAAGRATDDEGSPPYRPVSQVLRVLGLPDPLGGGAVADGRADVAAQERFRRYEAVSEALRAAAAPAGLFVLLDDLHWADAGTLRLLVHVARDVPGRLVLVATYRTTEPATDAVFGGSLAALAVEPVVERIVLTGLSEAEVGRQLDAVTGFAVPAGVAQAVHRRTHGNPFFVGELGLLLTGSPPAVAEPGLLLLPAGSPPAVAEPGPLPAGSPPAVTEPGLLLLPAGSPPAVAEPGLLLLPAGSPPAVAEPGPLPAGSPPAVAELRLPDGVRDAVRARLARLSAQCRRVVRAAAVLGAAPDAAVLAEVTGLEPAGVLSVLDEAAAAGILTRDAGTWWGTAGSPEGGGDGFTHDLIREAAAAEVPTAERMLLHARMAAGLCGRPDADARAAEIAHHLVASLPLGAAAEAVAWSRRAGDRAAALLAWEEAAAWYGRALDAAAGLPLPAAERAALLTGRAAAQVRGYDMDGARESLTAATGVARDAGDPEAFARAVLVMEGVSDFLWDPVGRSLAQEAVEALPDADSGLRARLMAQVVVMDAWRQTADAGPRSLAAVEMAERTGDRRALVEALRARQFALSSPAGAEERLSLGTRLLAIGADGDDDALLWGRLWRFDAYAQLGDLAAASTEAEAVAALADRTRSTLAGWHAIRSRAALTAATGDFAEALALAGRSLALARRSGSEGSIQPSVGVLLGICALTGDRSAVALEGAFGLPETMAAGWLRGALALWKLAAGERAEAERLYRGVPPVEHIPPFVRLPAVSGMIELAAEFDDLAAVATLHDMLLADADRFVCGGAGVIMIGGPARLPLGIGAAALGRHDEAVAHLRAAIDLGGRAGMPPAVATARYHLARALLRRDDPGDRAAAAVHATDAAAAALRLGMRPLAAQVAGLETGAAQRRPDPLTPREREIAGHVARGLTNKAIAAELYLSERTVETHVQRVLTKLGLANRTQVATWHLRSTDT